MWTRKFFDQWEWYHRPVSPMEESLLLPKHIDQSLSLISKRLGIKFPSPAWRVINGYLYMRGNYYLVLFQPAMMLLPFKFRKEMPIAASRWTDKILPEYQEELERVKIMDLQKFSRDKLIEMLEKIVELEGKFMAESVYVVLYAISSEVLLKIAYALFVRDPGKINYQELLIGFPDAGLEADAQLWKISRLNGKNRQSEIQDWIGRFGHRIQDKDILYPTLGEDPKVLKVFLNLYKDSASPAEKVKIAIEKRRQREIFAESHIKNVPGARRLFNHIRLLGQNYARIRNSRPYYYQGNANIRRILFEASRRMKWLENKNGVFYLRAEELTPAIEGAETEKLKALIKTRKTAYQRRLQETPPLEVKE